MNFTVSAHTAEETFCVNISIVDDLILEATEQFVLYFENLPSALAVSGTPDTINVDIMDNGGKSRVTNTYMHRSPDLLFI